MYVCIYIYIASSVGAPAAKGGSFGGIDIL